MISINNPQSNDKLFSKEDAACQGQAASIEPIL